MMNWLPNFLFKSFAAVSRRLGFEEDYSVEPHVIGQRLLAYAERKGVEIYTNACVVQTQYQQEVVRFVWQVVRLIGQIKF